MFRSAILLSFFLAQGCTIQSGLLLINDCSCPGHNLTFECVVNGTNEGTTVWKGAALQDACMLPEILLLHREFEGTFGDSECTGGGTIAWRTLGIENNFYRSQLNITYMTDLIGKAVVCAYDTIVDEIIIGSRRITTTNFTTYPPPSEIHLESADQNHLIFSWNDIVPACAAVRYTVRSTGCGICPDTIAHNSASCNHFQVSTTGNLCTFAVQSEFCHEYTTYRTIGSMSDHIRVTLKDNSQQKKYYAVPEPPIVHAIISRYSYSSGNTTGFIVQFNEIPSFIISAGIDDIEISYALTYNNFISGASCGSATVPASSCVNGVCQHSFTYEESACSSASVGINVSISAANVLGGGPASYPIAVQENTNTFFNASINLASNSVVCTFHTYSQHNSLCSIEYWLNEDKICVSSSKSFTQTSYSTSDVVIIGLPSSSLPSRQYCFNVTGDNGTYTAVLEGVFNTNKTIIQESTQGSNEISFGVSLTFVILIGLIIITALLVVIVFLIRAYRKVQVQLVKVQTVKAPVPVCTTPITAIQKPNTNRIYEELDGDVAHADEVLDVENLAYPTKDFHRSRCATPCSDSGEAEGAYYCTI